MKVKSFIGHTRQLLEKSQNQQNHALFMDAAAKGSSKDLSLNDCLETGPNYKV